MRNKNENKIRSNKTARVIAARRTINGMFDLNCFALGDWSSHRVCDRGVRRLGVIWRYDGRTAAGGQCCDASEARTRAGSARAVPVRGSHTAPLRRAGGYKRLQRGGGSDK